MMKRKIISIAVALVMVLTMMPMTAMGSDSSAIAPTMEKVTVEDDEGNSYDLYYFFANGTSIKIQDNKPEGATKGTFEDIEVADDAEGAYIVWTWDKKEYYYRVQTEGAGVEDNKTYVIGGKKVKDKDVSVTSTSITMTGGQVYGIIGGNWAENSSWTYNNHHESVSTVTDYVDINITGGKVINLISGGGRCFDAVNGTVTIDIEEPAELGENCYVMGGVWGNGNEGSRYPQDRTIETKAKVKKAVIKMEGIKQGYVFGGGGGSTYMCDTEIHVDGCNLKGVYIVGVNGQTEDAYVNISNSKIATLSSTNRGILVRGKVDVADSEVVTLCTGAPRGCFKSDSGSDDVTGITESITYNIDAKTTVTNTYLTPNAITESGQLKTPFSFVGQTINKKGAALKATMPPFDSGKEGTVEVDEFDIPGGLTFNNIDLTIPSGIEVSNKGTMNIGHGSIVNNNGTITNNKGAEIDNNGRLVNNGTIANDGTLDNYNGSVEGEGKISGEGKVIDPYEPPETPSEVTDAMIEAMQIPDVSDIGFDADDKAAIDNAREAYEKAIATNPAYEAILAPTLEKIEAAEAAYVAAKRTAFEATEPDIELSKDEFYYNKKAKTPDVVSGLEAFTEGADYEITYVDNIKAGIGSVVIEGKGDLEGFSVSKDILIRPYKGVINKVTTKRNSMVVTSRDQSAGGITGYQFAWRVTNSGDDWKTKMTSTKNYKTTIKKLKANTRYTVKVRGIVKVDGVRYYGDWSKLKKVRTAR